jgi:hypothetical protein
MPLSHGPGVYHGVIQKARYMRFYRSCPNWACVVGNCDCVGAVAFIYSSLKENRESIRMFNDIYWTWNLQIWLIIWQTCVEAVLVVMDVLGLEGMLK